MFSLKKKKKCEPGLQRVVGILVKASSYFYRRVKKTEGKWYCLWGWVKDIHLNLVSKEKISLNLKSQYVK